MSYAPEQGKWVYVMETKSDYSKAKTSYPKDV